MKAVPKSVQRNVLYSVLDYVSQPVTMIAAAPFLLRTLGIEQYGTWMLVNSIAAAASGLGGGFGDGAVKYTSMYRGLGDRHGAVRSVLAVLIVNLTFGFLSAAAMIVCAPWLMNHVFTVAPSLRAVGVTAVRISALALLLRFAESVFTSSVRGCERYRPVVILSCIARALVTSAAVVLAWAGYGLVAILWATLAIGVASLTSQAWLAHRVLHATGIWRHVKIADGVREVFSFGAFTWLKSTLGVAIGYADRLLVAALLGTSPLAIYTLCNQITQPIHSLIASGFNFVFPNLSAQGAAGQWSTTRNNYRVALLTSIVTVVAICAPMIAGARLILRYWLGAVYASQYHGLLVAMIIGNGLLAVGVVPHYAALALGRSRALVWLNFAAGVLSLSCGYFLMKKSGLMGGGMARIVAGLVFLFVFQIVRSGFRESTAARSIEESSCVPIAALDLG